MCTAAKQLMGWTQGLVTKSQDGGSNAFMAAVLTKGGAEGWLQVELNHIYNTLPNTVWVQREQHVYKDLSWKTDFLIQCQGGGQTCIEIKVENLFESSAEGRVTMDHTRYRAVQDDYERLKSDLNADHANDDAFVIAITWSQEATTGLDNWIRQNGLNVERDQVMVSHEKSDWLFTVYVIVVKGG